MVWSIKTPVLIEATCNQVNQFGGYTGMTPVDFVRFVSEIADRVEFPRQNLILGGDHLGPLVWSNEPSGVAMQKAKKLVRGFALAGFGKIHLDCSIPCADDGELPVELIARRAAELAREVELACTEAGLPLPRYVVGSEVPPAGGAKAVDHQFTITNPADAARTIELTHLAFTGLDLEAAWERVIALVVQPGVEFGDDTIHDYDRTQLPASPGSSKPFQGWYMKPTQQITRLKLLCVPWWKIILVFSKSALV